MRHRTNVSGTGKTVVLPIRKYELVVASRITVGDNVPASTTKYTRRTEPFLSGVSGDMNEWRHNADLKICLKVFCRRKQTSEYVQSVFKTIAIKCAELRWNKSLPSNGDVKYV